MTDLTMEEKNLTQLIHHRTDIKNKMDDLNKQLKELRAEQDFNDVLLLRKMDAEGVSRTANDAASASLSWAPKWGVSFTQVGTGNSWTASAARMIGA